MKYFLKKIKTVNWNNYIVFPIKVSISEKKMTSKAEGSMSPNHFQTSGNWFIHQTEHYLSARNIVHSGEQEFPPHSAYILRGETDIKHINKQAYIIMLGNNWSWSEEK